MDQPATDTIALTDNAVARVKEAMRQDGLGPDHALRLSVSTGGCSGFSYQMSFDRPRGDEPVLEIDGVRIVIDPEAQPYLAGITLDYVTGLHGSAFKFENPNATRTCGCGTSFGV